MQLIVVRLAAIMVMACYLVAQTLWLAKYCDNSEGFTVFALKYTKRMAPEVLGLDIYLVWVPDILLLCGAALLFWPRRLSGLICSVFGLVALGVIFYLLIDIDNRPEVCIGNAMYLLLLGGTVLTLSGFLLRAKMGHCDYSVDTKLTS